MSQYTPFADLTGRTAVVTGASSGIGQAIAIELAAGGADLLLVYHNNLQGAESTADQVRQLGRSASLFQADISQESSCEALFQQLEQHSSAFDIWVNNAGADVLTGEMRDWDFQRKLTRLFEVDLQGTILLSRLAGEFFSRQKRGVIINIGWDQAERGMEGDSGELFASIKNGIMGFSRSLALSLAPDVRVNCVAPGWIKTAWGDTASESWQQRVISETPLKRWGVPQDIAKLVRFLVSEEASYLTGQVIYANGGAER